MSETKTAKNDSLIPDFDSLTPSGEKSEGEWVDLKKAGDEIVGRIKEMRENVGDFNSRLYVLDDDSETEKLLWGKGPINYAVDENGLGKGDILAVRRTGNTYTNKFGEHPEYEVRFMKQEQEQEN